jgi:type III restriction enzyme
MLTCSYDFKWLREEDRLGYFPGANLGSHVVADTEAWGQKMAQVLDEMEEIVCYAKNQNLGFAIPYTIEGEEKYQADFLMRVQQGEDPLKLIIEVTGDKEKGEGHQDSHGQDLMGTCRQQPR